MAQELRKQFNSFDFFKKKKKKTQRLSYHLTYWRVMLYDRPIEKIMRESEKIAINEDNNKIDIK